MGEISFTVDPHAIDKGRLQGLIADLKSRLNSQEFLSGWKLGDRFDSGARPITFLGTDRGCRSGKSARLRDFAGRRGIRQAAVVVAALFFPSVSALSQATILYSDFGESTPFNDWMKQNQYGADQEQLVASLKDFFKSYCNTRDLKILRNDAFLCENRICVGTRTRVLQGASTANIVVTHWNFSVSLTGPRCQHVRVSVN